MALGGCFFGRGGWSPVPEGGADLAWFSVRSEDHPWREGRCRPGGAHRWTQQGNMWAKENRRENRNTNVAKDRPDAGATRLIKILISEAAYLIWITRCERAIRGNEHTERETRAAWRKTLNRRISEDTTTASRVRRTSDYINLIKSTWEKSLEKFYGSIPNNWIHRGKGF